MPAYSALAGSITSHGTAPSGSRASPSRSVRIVCDLPEPVAPHTKACRFSVANGTRNGPARAPGLVEHVAEDHAGGVGQLRGDVKARRRHQPDPRQLARRRAGEGEKELRRRGERRPGPVGELQGFAERVRERQRLPPGHDDVRRVLQLARAAQQRGRGAGRRGGVSPDRRPRTFHIPVTRDRDSSRKRPSARSRSTRACSELSFLRMSGIRNPSEVSSSSTASGGTGSARTTQPKAPCRWAT